MYCELHARSAFSFLEGAAIPEELIALCAERGISSMALLDRDGVYGAARFHLAGVKAGVKGHIGAEGDRGRRRAICATGEIARRYQNLCQLITKMKLRSAKGEEASRWQKWRNSAQDWFV